jgi:hypothetical protein
MPMAALMPTPASPPTRHSQHSEECAFFNPRGQAASYGSSGSSSSAEGFVTGGFFAAGAAAAVFAGGDKGFVPGAPDGFAATLVTTKYFRIFSSRFGPIPRTASKSSTLLNAPYAFRICRILSAVDGPIPGTCCNCSDVAVFKLTGDAGGFFLPTNDGVRSRLTARGMANAMERQRMAH